MRNVWKGMVIGALTGAAAGLALDLGEQGAEGAVALGGAVAQHAPEVADHLRQVVTGAASAAADRGRSSELPSQAKAMAAGTREKVSAAVSDGLHRVNDVADQSREKLAHAADRAGNSVRPA